MLAAKEQVFIKKEDIGTRQPVTGADWAIEGVLFQTVLGWAFVFILQLIVLLLLLTAKLKGCIIYSINIPYTNFSIIQFKLC